MRVDPEHPLEIFRTRDHHGRIGLSMKFKAEMDLPPNLPRLRGFSVWAGESPTELRLTLLTESDWEVFHALSEDLARAANAATQEQHALDAVLARIERWQRMLAKDRSGLLTDQELRGLYGELTFLRGELLPRFGSSAVEFWNGPEGSAQDFAIFSTMVEVKTRTGAGPARVRISSPEQLWAGLSSMYLRVYFLAIDDPRGMTINKLVAGIRADLAGSEALAAFDRKLEALGFIDLPEYESTSYLACQEDTFIVGPGFPSITPASVPEGVSHLSYDISLDHCRPFVAAIPWPISGAISNGTC